MSFSLKDAIFTKRGPLRMFLKLYVARTLQIKGICTELFGRISQINEQEG